jgi:hypothetical protein
MSERDGLAALHEELAANARARIPYLIARVEDDEYRELEARAVQLRAAIRAASPPPSWEQYEEIRHR